MDSQQPKPKFEPVYSKHLQNHINQVIEQGSLSRKQLQQFISAFQKRVDAEIAYAKSLESVSKALEKFIQPKTQKAASYVCSAFKVSNQQRAHQARQLAESIKTEIIDYANQMLKEHQAQAKRIQKGSKKITKDFTYYEETLQRAQKNYKQINKETQQMIMTKNIVKYTSQLPQQKKIKIISKTMESLKEKREYENLYIQAVSQYNQYLGLFKKQTTSFLDVFQEHQQSRIRLQGDCIRKLIVSQISMFKNVEYDILNINKVFSEIIQQMETIDPRKDIQIFVQQAKSKEREQKKDQKQKKLEQKILDIDKSMLAISLRKVQEEYFSWMLNLKKNKIIKGVIEQRWKVLISSKPKQKQYSGLDQIEQKQNDDCQNTPQKQDNGIVLNQQISDRIKQDIKEEKVGDASNQKSQDLSEQRQNEQPVESKSNPTEQGSIQNRVSVDTNNRNSSDICEVRSQISDQNSNKEDKAPQLNQKEKQMLALWVQVQQKQKIFSQPCLTGQISPQIIPVQQIFYDFLKMTQIISKYWVGLIQPTGNKLKSSYHMKKIKKILRKGHLMRILAQVFIEQYRIQHQVTILTEGVKPVAQIFALILDQCSKNDDAYVGRGLIGLLFTFNFLDEKQNKKLLYQHSSIVGSKLWRKLDFWDAAIYQSTYEQMAVFSFQKGQTHSQTVLREKNLIFSQLASYCHYMIMLGVSSKNVRVTVGRYCRLYQMNEEQNKDLSKMITNTFRQYKDMLAVGAIKG